MFFEGAEKKVELVVGPKLRPLRAKSEKFWEKIVLASGATILSKIENDSCTAFVLSESSLFVWNDRVLLLTCGTTKLVDAVMLMESEFGAENIESLIFQRKNEFRAWEQSTNFLEDVESFKTRLDGTAMRFGKIDSHHNLLFHLNKPFEFSEADSTLEFLMYDISSNASDFFMSEENSAQNIREYLHLEKVLPGYLIDDFKFEPYGYSLNAIKGNLYYTIHITPQESSPYVSFETNDEVGKGASSVLGHFCELLGPASFDLVGFNLSLAELEISDKFKCRTFFKDKLKNNYDVEFGYYFRDGQEVEKPFFF